MSNGVIRYQLCTLHTYISDLNNLKNEGRRSIGKQHSNVDVINVLSTCYELEEVKLRNHFEEDDEFWYVQSVLIHSKLFLHVRANANS